MIAFDFRGSGLSGYPNYPRSIHYRDDVIAAVAQLRRDGARKVAVLGISRGGPAALTAARAALPAARPSCDRGRTDRRARRRRLDQGRAAVTRPAPRHGQRARRPRVDADRAHAIYRASTSRHKELVIAPGQGHGDVFRFPRAWNAFVAFLRREVG